MEIWTVNTLKNGSIELTAPNGTICFRVSPETAEVIGQMLLDEVQNDVQDEEVWDDWEEDDD